MTSTRGVPDRGNFLIGFSCLRDLTDPFNDFARMESTRLLFSSKKLSLCLINGQYVLRQFTHLPTAFFLCCDFSSSFISRAANKFGTYTQGT